MKLWSARPRVHVDDVRLDEADALADIHGGAFARTWSEDDFAALLGDTGVFALGVRRRLRTGRSRLAGFVLVRTAADESEILTIAVRPGDRGRGYGRLLMDEALRRLYRDRVAACFLEVDPDNRAAVSLYRSLGFVVAGERKHYYANAQSGGGAALVMRTQLR
jgi:ribosomal-protein-alanine N-acetyltransferase